ncbi:MAG: Type 1 glutamine amidotransferase-like domain-containing protein [bacterium]|nr:Type 1 glutamine amidotransferase-like domain-containing protein [bacterium]
MKLLLTSSGITNKFIIKTLLELLGKPLKESHLTFIPTAANVEAGKKTWLAEDISNFKNLQPASFNVVDIAVSPKDIWYPSFKKADVLIFGGGNVKYLLRWIKKSRLEKYLPEFLKNKVYVGISAGSRVLTRSLVLSSSGTKKDVGLGIVNLSIVPHINSKHFPERTFKRVFKESRKIPYPVYAIDDNTALKIIDGKVEVVSEGDWKKFN